MEIIGATIASTRTPARLIVSIDRAAASGCSLMALLHENGLQARSAARRRPIPAILRAGEDADLRISPRLFSVLWRVLKNLISEVPA